MAKKTKMYIPTALDTQTVQYICMTYYDASKSTRNNVPFSKFYNDNQKYLSAIAKAIKTSVVVDSVYNLHETCSDLLTKNSIAHRKKGEKYADYFSSYSLLLERGHERFTKALEKAGKDDNTVTIFELPEGAISSSGYDLEDITQKVEQKIAGGNTEVLTLEYQAPEEL